jgi:hypothetical protein
MSLNNPSATSSSTGSDKSIWNRTPVLWFSAIVGLFVWARLWRLASACLWFDEIFSIHAARHAWADLFHFVAADIIHPPFFYALLKVWIALGGESVAWLRLLPALLGIAAIVPFTLVCRELKFKANEINLALLLLAVNGYLIKYAQEVRMYSLLFFLSVCSLWLFFRFFNRGNARNHELAALGLVNLLLIYTHYAGWMVVLLQAFVLLLWQRRKLKGFLVTAGLLALAYVPWIYVVLKVTGSGAAGRGLAENIGWVTRPGIFDLTQYFVLLNRPFLFVQSSTDTGFNLIIAGIAFVLFGLPLLAFFFDREKYKDSHPTIYVLIVFSLAPVIVAFVLSWLSPYSVWGTRHLIVAAAPYSILTALALLRLRPNWLRVTALSMIGCWFFLSAAVFLFSRPTNFIWCSWEQLAQQAVKQESTASGPVQIYAYEDLVAYHLWFALQEKGKVTVVKGVPGIPEDRAYFLPRGFNDISVQRNNPTLTGDKIWVAFRASQWDETRPPLDGIKRGGFKVGRVSTVKAQGQQAFLVELLRSEGP